MNSLTNSLRSLTVRGTLPARSTLLVPSSSRSFSSTPSTSSSKLDEVLKQVQQSKPNTSPKNQQNQNRKGGGGGNARKSSFYPSELGTSTTPSYRTAVNHHPKFTPETPQEIWSYSAPVPYSPSVTTTSARSFAVQSGNVARAYRNLNRVLNENQVRRELKRQERFESPSNKRVRLNSERHRRRFKVAVGKAVSLAMRMKDL
ncbi:hypothetical protein JCM5350_003971 [Sporobolomyces pararoseus]